MPITTINIGLNTNKGASITPEQAHKALTAFAYVLWSRIAQSETEPTLVAQIEVKNGHAIEQAINHLCDTLQQDCVALSHDNGLTGQLIGPNAASWGQFDPAYFIKATD